MSVTEARVEEVAQDDEVSNNGMGELTELSDGVGLTSTSRSL